MTVEELVVSKLRSLPAPKQKGVLDFVESLEAAPSPPPKLKPILGICADLGIDISEDDIAEARGEMWGNFPRDLE